MDYPFEVVSSDADSATVAIQCPFCGKTSLLKVSNAGLRARQAGALIQVAFPDMPAADRELFVSGICAACFPKAPEDEEEDEDFDCEDADDCDEDDCDGCGGCDEEGEDADEETPEEDPEDPEAYADWDF